jgi:hypothetical protein
MTATEIPLPSSTKHSPSASGRDKTHSASACVLSAADGTRLAARLWLPEELPAPVILEALPYRMDDLTSSYAGSYRSLCENHRYAVARIDVRGTGSSPGDALDEYPEAEQRDLPDAFAWLAAQDWCDGQIGMWGTSYSGFNSLQIAMERPLGRIARSTPHDRWTDDVLARRRCAWLTWRLLPLRPDVRAAAGAGGLEEGGGRSGSWLTTNEPWALTWLREPAQSLDHGSSRCRDDIGLRADRLPGDDRGGMGRRVPQQLVPHDRRELARHGVPIGYWPSGATPTRRPRCPVPGSTSGG